MAKKTKKPTEEVKEKDPKNKNKDGEEKKESKFLKFLSKIMPYVLAVIFTVFLFSYLGFLGGFGRGLKEGLFGFMSSFAAVLFMVLLLYHSIMWYYDVNRKICVRRIICSLFTVLGISVLQHLIQYASSDAIIRERILAQNVDIAYNCGVNGFGGGVLGGLIGNLIIQIDAGNYAVVVLSIIITLFILTFLFLQMFNITPLSILRAIFKKKPKEKKPKKQKPKHKVVEIFDDDIDDLDESNIEEITESQTTEANPASETPKYASASEIIEEAQSIETSSQLKPYDQNRDYTKTEGDGELAETENATSDVDDLVVETTKVENEETPKEEFVVTETKLNDEEETENASEFVPEDTGMFEFVSDEEDEEDEEDYFEGEDDIDEALFDNEVEDKEETQAVEDSFEEAEGEEAALEEEPSYDEAASQPTNEEEEEEEEETSYIPTDLLNKVNHAPKPDESLIVEKAPVVNTPPVKAPEPPKPKKRIKYVFPPLDLLNYNPEADDTEAITAELQERAKIIVDTLNSFNVRTKIVDIARGPTVTRYEIAPEPGVRVKNVANLADDIALNLAAEDIRMECPIPGKSAIGIEVPNKIPSIVFLKELIANKKFKEAKSVLTCALGKSISGEVQYVDIEKTPHLLVAGATSMGKSVCINSMLISLLYKSDPNDVRLILIDPKRVEFSDFNGLPHLLVPVVTEPKKSLGALQWSVAEMDRRFEVFQPLGVRNIGEYNAKIDNGYEGEKMARVVIVIDELADLKMSVPDIEGYIQRLTQKARAAGMHIIIGTQRPSVDVITGVIKSNIPSRISFRVSSNTDSRTILDEVGAEKLVHRGDMLAKIIGGPLRPVRLQGSLVTAEEVQAVIEFIKANSSENYDESVMDQIDSNAAKLAKAEKKDDDDSDGGSSGGDEFDDKFYAALKVAAESGKISSSFLMRKLGLGFQRASKIIDQMEECGYIGEANGSKPREVLISKEDYNELMMRREETNN